MRSRSSGGSTAPNASMVTKRRFVPLATRRRDGIVGIEGALSADSTVRSARRRRAPAMRRQGRCARVGRDAVARLRGWRRRNIEQHAGDRDGSAGASRRGLARPSRPQQKRHEGRDCGRESRIIPTTGKVKTARGWRPIAGRFASGNRIRRHGLCAVPRESAPVSHDLRPQAGQGARPRPNPVVLLRLRLVRRGGRRCGGRSGRRARVGSRPAFHACGDLRGQRRRDPGMGGGIKVDVVPLIEVRRDVRRVVDDDTDAASAQPRLHRRDIGARRSLVPKKRRSLAPGCRMTMSVPLGTTPSRRLNMPAVTSPFTPALVTWASMPFLRSSASNCAG